jgi:competence protein ComEA
MDTFSRNPVPPLPPPPSASEQPPIALSRGTSISLLVLLSLITGLIGWRWYLDRYGARPTTLQAISTHRIDLNRATRAELMQIPGVGPQLADRIVLHREERGAFTAVEELTSVHGIGDSTLNKIRPWIAIHATDAERRLPEPERLTRKSPKAGSTLSSIGPGQKTNVNTATLEQLDRLPNIGSVLAGRIIAEREKRPFESVDDLRRVSGIGPKRLDALRGLVTVSD